jgi:hypothetical protein
MPAELADDFRARAHAIVRTWLRGDVEGLVALVGDDADELLPTRGRGETLLPRRKPASRISGLLS